jgi:hypothetical protein
VPVPVRGVTRQPGLAVPLLLRQGGAASCLAGQGDRPHAAARTAASAARDRQALMVMPGAAALVIVQDAAVVVPGLLRGRALPARATLLLRDLLDKLESLPDL